MVTLSTAQITGIVSLALILSGAVVLDVLERTYYCPTEDNVRECIRLSSSGITCYYLLAEDITKGDRCTGGVWELFETKKRTDKVSPDISIAKDCIQDGKWCYCNPRGLIKNKRLC